MADQQPLYPPDNQTPTEPSQALYSPTEVTPALPDSVVQQRAEKYDYALGETSPGVEALKNNIHTGAEAADRLRLANQKAVEARTINLQVLDEFAKSKQGVPMTPEETQFVMGLTQEEIQHPETIMEKEYARKILHDTATGQSNPTLNQALKDDPVGVQEHFDIAENLVARQEAFRKLYDTAQQNYNNTNPVQKALQTVSDYIPFNSWASTFNAVEGAPTTGILPGSNMEEQIKYLYTIPIDEAVPKLQATLDNMVNGPGGSNLHAVHFMEGVMSYPTSSKNLDNIFGVLDVASVIPVGKVISGVRTAARNVKASRAGSKSVEDVTQFVSGGTGTPLQRFQAGLKATVQTLAKKDLNVVEAQAAAGNSKLAAVGDAIRRVKEKIGAAARNLGEAGSFDTITKQVPSLWNSGKWWQNPLRFTNEAARRAANEVNETTPALLSAIESGLTIDRVPDSVWGQAVIQASESVALKYPQAADRVLDVTPSLETNLANTRQVEIHIGDENVLPYQSPESAAIGAEVMGLKDVRIVGEGNAYHIVIHHTVDETDDKIRQLLVATDNQTPRSFATEMLGNWRSPEDLRSQSSNMNATIAVYGQSRLTGLVKGSAKRIGMLPGDSKITKYLRDKFGWAPSNKSRDKLLNFIEADRVHESTITTPSGTEVKKVGRYAKSVSEFETRWFEKFGEYPSEREAIAYHEYVRLSDLDWVMRNVDLYRQKARLGVGVYDVRGKGFEAPGIEGVVRKELPYDATGDPTVLILSGDKPKLWRMNDSKTELRETVERLQSEGHRIIQVSTFGERDLKKVQAIREATGNDNIHFVVTNDFDSRALPIKQIPYNPGGHIENPDGFLIGQADITRVEKLEADGSRSIREHRYNGDKSLRWFSSEAKAKKFAERFDAVRKMLRNGTSDEVIDDFITKNLDKTPEQVRNLFRPTFDDNGHVLKDAAFSLDEEISHRFMSQRFGDTLNLKAKYANFKDAQHDPFNLYNGMDFEFTGSRNPIIDTIEESGSTLNPIYNTKPAKLIDAFSTMNRAMVSVMESKYLNDFKVSEVEKFIQEFSHLISSEIPIDDLKRNPMKYILGNEVPWVKNPKDLQELAAAKASLGSLKQFLGSSTEFSKHLKGFKQKMINSVYNKFGDKGVDIVEPYLLYTTKDPAKFFRSVAFHTKLGLFNPVQLFLQAQGFAHIMALSPKYAMHGASGYSLMRLMNFTDDPAIIEAFAKKAEKLGWNKDEFMEAYEGLRRSGMDRVDSEVAMRDDVMDPNLIQTKAGKFLDMSSSFFNEGERFVRISAYNASYMEWRAANKFAKYTQQAEKGVLQRADFMALNMTRKSNASWQRGWASIPTQFFAYQARLAEQLLGKRLGATVAERTQMRARLFGTYSLIYGIPVGISAFTGIWPWEDTIRTQLISRGIPYDENIITRALMDGLASTTLQAITGGEKYNVGQRYGPNGLNALRDFLTGERSGVETLVGVAGTTMGDIISSFWPILGEASNVFTGDQSRLPVLIGDLVDATRNVSTANQALKTWAGLQTHQYVTKNEMVLDDISSSQALFIGLAGLTPQEIPDAFLMNKIIQSEKEAKELGKKEAVKYLKRAYKEEDPDIRMSFMTRAKEMLIVSGISPHDYSEVMHESFDRFTTFVDSMNYRFAKSSPERMQALIRKRQL